MGRWFAATAFVTFGLAASAASCVQAAPRFSPEAAERIERAAAEQVASGRTVGLAIQVVQDGRVVFSRGYGKANLEWDRDVTPDTVFKIASNTKSFTAASILILADRGKLSLDDRVSRHLPEFPGADRITIRQLLNHTSGLATYDETYRGKPELAVQKTTAEMLALIQTLTPLYEFEPGTAYKYSNSGFYLIGAIVERISGQSLDQFIAANIAAPLGLKHTAMDEIEDIVPQRAAGYERVEGAPGVYRNAIYVPYTTPGPAGGLRSTVGDLAAWYEGLFGGRVVSAALVKEMTTPARVTDGRPARLARWAPSGLQAQPAPDYEVGFGVRMSQFAGHREYWHSGAVEGFTSQIRTYPDDGVTISLLANTFRALDGVLETVQRAALGVPDRPAATPRPEEPKP